MSADQKYHLKIFSNGNLETNFYQKKKKKTWKPRTSPNKKIKIQKPKKRKLKKKKKGFSIKKKRKKRVLCSGIRIASIVRTSVPSVSALRYHFLLFLCVWFLRNFTKKKRKILVIAGF